MRNIVSRLALLVTGVLLPGWTVVAADTVPEIALYTEFVRCDHQGKPVAADVKTPADAQPLDPDIAVRVARNGYASFHLVVHGAGAGYTLAAETMAVPVAPGGATPPQLQVDLYTEWYHGFGADRAKPETVIPDGLVPYTPGAPFSIPHAEMKVPDQSAQGFWVDIWVPADAPVGKQAVKLTLGRENHPPTTVTLQLDIAAAAIPNEDAITADHNCYGLGFVSKAVAPWPATFTAERPWRFSPEYFSVIHSFHRQAFDHRCSFHQLGTNHTGGFSPEFNPETSGEARTLKIDSWEKFDAHYGPLLDGSAMAGCRRAETYERRPIPFVYTAITPEWPAPFVHWGTPAYEYEFVKIVRAMHDHFAAKKWTRTNFELFFNHKMRYKGFPWDGDETRFDSDDPFFVEYARLLSAALPLPEKPPAQLRDKWLTKDGVRFVFRSDSSWNIGHQIPNYSGVVNFWVLGSGCASFWPAQMKMAVDRGDIVWFYGGTPQIQKPSSDILEMPARAYFAGYEGYVRWLVTGGGDDPWNTSDGGGELLYYPGGARGFRKPLPCIRLKLERNGLQDVALLKAVGTRAGGHAAFAKKLLATAKLTPDCFWAPDAALVKKPVIEWNNPDIGEHCAKGFGVNPELNWKAWWQAVRAAALDVE